MTTSTERADLVLVDTNVLVYAHDLGNPKHGVCRDLLINGSSLCIAPQTITEFYAVVTSTRRVTRPRSPQDAVGAIERLLQNPAIVLLPVPPDLVTRLLSLLRKYPVTQQKVFDLQLVATMLGNGVERIYTYNVGDFEQMDELQVLTPGR